MVLQARLAAQVQMLLAGTMNDRLDYLGSVVNIAARLEHLSSGTDVIVSDAIRHDPEVAELLSAPDIQLDAEQFEAQLKGFDKEQFHLWRVRSSPTGVSHPSSSAERGSITPH